MDQRCTILLLGALVAACPSLQPYRASLTVEDGVTSETFMLEDGQVYCEGIDGVQVGFRGVRALDGGFVDLRVDLRLDPFDRTSLPYEIQFTPDGGGTRDQTAAGSWRGRTGPAVGGSVEVQEKVYTGAENHWQVELRQVEVGRPERPDFRPYRVSGVLDCAEGVPGNIKDVILILLGREAHSGEPTNGREPPSGGGGGGFDD